MFSSISPANASVVWRQSERAFVAWNCALRQPTQNRARGCVHSNRRARRTRLPSRRALSSIGQRPSVQAHPRDGKYHPPPMCLWGRLGSLGRDTDVVLGGRHPGRRHVRFRCERDKFAIRMSRNLCQRSSQAQYELRHACSRLRRLFPQLLAGSHLESGKASVLRWFPLPVLRLRLPRLSL